MYKLLTASLLIEPAHFYCLIFFNPRPSVPNPLVYRDSHRKSPKHSAPSHNVRYHKTASALEVPKVHALEVIATHVSICFGIASFMESVVEDFLKSQMVYGSQHPVFR